MLNRLYEKFDQASDELGVFKVYYGKNILRLPSIVPLIFFERSLCSRRLFGVFNYRWKRLVMLTWQPPTYCKNRLLWQVVACSMQLAKKSIFLLFYWHWIILKYLYYYWVCCSYYRARIWAEAIWDSLRCLLSICFVLFYHNFDVCAGGRPCCSDG